jgi:hypothetical protein
VNAADAGFAGAMSAAIERALGFNAVTDDFAIAVLAFGSKRVDGAFETVKIMGLTLDSDFQRFVVIVSANFTFVHTIPPLDSSSI